MTHPTSSRRAALAMALGLAGAALAAAPAMAASVTVPMALATEQGAGASVGTITVSDAAGGHGVSLALDLHDLPPGPHGFHLHANPSCEPSKAADGKITPAGAAGPHLDPAKTEKHLGPHGAGHLGDLPLIEVGKDGKAKQTLEAHRFASVADFQGRSLMIHAGGDTYSDTPTLGGGGARLACGVVR